MAQDPISPTVLFRRLLMVIAFGIITYLTLAAVGGVYPFNDGMDHDPLIHPSRPGLARHPRYSKEHRYRPAASPVVVETDWLGRVRAKGDYMGTYRHHREL